MKVWCLALVTLLLWPVAVAAQVIAIEAHPQKAVYASQEEYPFNDDQTHWAPANAALEVGHVPHVACSDNPLYGRFTGPVTVDCVLRVFKAAGRIVQVWGDQGVAITWPQCGGCTTIPNNLIGNPTGLSPDYPVRITFTPPYPHGIWRPRVFTRIVYDSGHLTNSIAMYPFFSALDTTAPKTNPSPARGPHYMAVAVDSSRIDGSGRWGQWWLEMDTPIPLAPLTGPWTITIRCYNYGWTEIDKTLGTATPQGVCEAMLDPDLHMGEPGQLLGRAFTGPNNDGSLTFTIGPGIIPSGKHKILVRAAQETGPGTAKIPAGERQDAIKTFEVEIAEGGIPPPPPPPAEICGNGIDDDLDGQIDEGCSAPPPPPPPTSAWTTSIVATDARTYHGIAADNGIVIVTEADAIANTTRVKRSTDSGDNFGPWMTLPGSGTAYIENPIDIDDTLVLIAGVDATQSITDFCCPRRVGAMVIWRSTDAGLTYTRQVIDANAKALRLSIDVEGQSAIVAWMGYPRGVWDIYVSRTSDGGVNWTTQVVALGTNAMGAQRPSVSLRGSLAYLAWMDGRDNNPPCPNENRILPVCTEIYGARSTNGGATWAVARLTANTGYAGRPDVLISESSRVDLAFDWRRTGMNNNDIGLLRSTDNGQTFAAPTFIAGPHVAEQTHAVLASGGSFLQAILMDARSGSVETRAQVIGSASEWLSAGNEAPAMATDASFLYAATKRGGTMWLHRKAIGSTLPPPPICSTFTPTLTWTGAALPLSFAPFTLTDANGCAVQVTP